MKRQKMMRVVGGICVAVVLAAGIFSPVVSRASILSDITSNVAAAGSSLTNKTTALTASVFSSIGTFFSDLFFAPAPISINITPVATTTTRTVVKSPFSTTRTVVYRSSGVTEAELTAKLAALEAKLSAAIATSTATGGFSPAGMSSSQLEDRLSYLRQSVASDMYNQQKNQPIIDSTAFTSLGTISAGSIAPGFGSIDIGANSLNAGTTTLVNLAVSGTATSTFAGNVNLTSGCFAINGVCLISGGTPSWGVIVGNIANQTDLQNALNLKLATSAFGTPFYTFFNSTTTSALAEGSNLYFTNARAVSALTGQNISLFTNNAGYLTNNQTVTLSGDVTGSGATAITTTIAAGHVTNAMLAGSIAGSKLVGTDITSLANLTTVGALTSGSIGSGFGNINIGSNTITSGAINTATISGGSLSSTAVNGVTTANILLSTGSYADPSWITSLAGSKISGLLTTNVAEGSNLYYTANRVAGVIAGTTTDALAQGSTNKYYATSLFNTDFGTKSTTNLAEGSNLYFTNAHAQTFLDSLNKGYFFSTTSVDYWKTVNNFFSTTSLASQAL